MACGGTGSATGDVRVMRRSGVVAGTGGDEQWWRGVAEAAEVPLAELVDGFADIAERPIQYGWLPVRAHSAYAGEATCWADLAAETISTLAGRPWSGAGTVRALLGHVAETVARHRTHHDFDR